MGCFASSLNKYESYYHYEAELRTAYIIYNKRIQKNSSIYEFDFDKLSFLAKKYICISAKHLLNDEMQYFGYIDVLGLIIFMYQSLDSDKLYSSIEANEDRFRLKYDKIEKELEIMKIGKVMI